MEVMLELTIKIPVICSCEETCICRDLIKCKKSCFCGGIKQGLEKRSEYSASSPDYNFHKKNTTIFVFFSLFRVKWTISY